MDVSVVLKLSQKAVSLDQGGNAEEARDLYAQVVEGLEELIPFNPDLVPVLSQYQTRLDALVSALGPPSKVGAMTSKHTSFAPSPAQQELQQELQQKLQQLQIPSRPDSEDQPTTYTPPSLPSSSPSPLSSSSPPSQSPALSPQQAYTVPSSISSFSSQRTMAGAQAFAAQVIALDQNGSPEAPVKYQELIRYLQYLLPDAGPNEPLLIQTISGYEQRLRQLTQEPTTLQHVQALIDQAAKFEETESSQAKVYYDQAMRLISDELRTDPPPPLKDALLQRQAYCLARSELLTQMASGRLQVAFGMRPGDQYVGTSPTFGDRVKDSLSDVKDSVGDLWSRITK